MNKSDSERIAGYLEKLGYKQCQNQSQADLVVLNTCGVRQKAEDRVYGLIHNIKKENPKAKIVLAGCLSERKDVQKRLVGKVDVWLPIGGLPNVKIQFLSQGLTSLWLRNKTQNHDYLKIKPKYGSKFTAFVPIGNGCNNFCAYCVVPYARGREVYRSVQEILTEVRNLVEKGYKEIVLIAQNVNSYKDGEINFSEILKRVNDVSGNFWIRFATSHPKDMSDELIKTITEGEKVCRHIHLPVQAGDDKILKAMNRNYTVAHYKNLIRKIRRVMPDVAITTDIIVGFPGETKKQFANTAKLFKEIKFDMAYIARYSPRPGTAVYKLKDDVTPVEKKRREEELMKILRKTALENNKKYLGKTVEVLVAGESRKGEWFGYTETNKKLKIKDKKLKMGIGEFIKTKIIKAKDFGLEGEMV